MKKWPAKSRKKIRLIGEKIALLNLTKWPLNVEDKRKRSLKNDMRLDWLEMTNNVWLYRENVDCRFNL